MSHTVLAFDIGIKNLAWCLMTKQDDKYSILGWQNYDLLRGEGNEVVKVLTKCGMCSANASYQRGTLVTCKRHCAESHPPLQDASGAFLKKIPSMALCRQILAWKGVTGGVNSKKKAEEKLAEKFSLPIQKQKQKKAIDTELTILHDAMRKFIGDNYPLFKKATHILLENQPVLKNPTMKSVQILLFATLRDILQPNPPQLLLVHASKKVQGAQTGDAGYTERKKGSEERVRTSFEHVLDSQKWKEFFEGHGKKNDLADAFSMCLDKLACGVKGVEQP
jgi:hypothetical protein